MAVRRSAAWGAVALLLLAAGYCCVGPGASRSPAALHDYARWRFGAAELPSAREQPARRWLQEQPEGAIADANATAIEAPSPPPPSPPLPRLDLRERLAALLHSAPEVQWTVVWQEVDPTFSAADDSSSNSTSSGNSTAAEAAAPAVDAQGASTPSPPPAPAPSVTDMGLLIDCLNAGSAHNATSWASATASDAVGSNLRAVASFTLNATAATLAAGVDPPPAPPKPTATLVTASSIDRLQQLHAQCRAWPGALSAVLFLGLLQEGGLATGAGVGDAQPPQQQQQEGGPAAAGPGSPLLGHTMAALQEALLQVAQFMVDMRSAPHACQPTVLLTYEIYSDRESMLLYPVNLLRNLARIQVRFSLFRRSVGHLILALRSELDASWRTSSVAQTMCVRVRVCAQAQSPLIAMLDVDLLPSKSLANRLVAHEDSARLLLSKVQQDRAVYIVPAFEPAPEFETASWAEALASSPSKEIMVMAMDKGIVTPFHFSRWAVGHQVTNFSHWHDSGTDYDVQYQMQ